MSPPTRMAAASASGIQPSGRIIDHQRRCRGCAARRDTRIRTPRWASRSVAATTHQRCRRAAERLRLCERRAILPIGKQRRRVRAHGADVWRATPWLADVRRVPRACSRRDACVELRVWGRFPARVQWTGRLLVAAGISLCWATEGQNAHLAWCASRRANHHGGTR